MKTFKYFLSIVLFVAAVVACTEDEFGSTEFISSVEAPANVVALYNVTQDNTGLVTITPNSEGAVSYDIYFGDGTTNPVKVDQGSNITNTYAEGSYEVKIIATGITGLKTEVTQPLVVSFKAPENAEVVMENDAAISKQVNVTATADYATMYDVYFGEEGNDEPVSANIGEIASYVYQEPGTYTITVVVKSAAIETVEVVQEFEVTEILQPIEKAPTSPDRESADVVSIYSDVYTNVEVSEWNPGWGQSTELSTFVIDEDNILKYDYLNYTGIVTSYDDPNDISAMEYVHFDYWTLGGETVGFKIVNTQSGYPDGDPLKESEVISTVTEFGQWVSVDIPLTDFTTDMSGISQMLFTSTGETVFIDNLYFYRGASGGSGLMIEDFEGTVPTFIDFDGGVTTVMENPESSGINTSANVGQMLRDGGQVWGGSKMVIDYQLDFSTFNAISMKVFTTAPVGTPIALKLEDNNDAGTSIEVGMVTTVSGAWETITFDYTGEPSATYDALVFLFDLGNVGDGSGNSTFLYDDIQQVSSDGGGNSGDYDLSLPIDFESEGFGANWTWNVFENGANDPLEFVANPSASGINTSSTVAKITALQAGAPWVGTETAHGEMGITWDLSASNSTIKIMVYKTVISDVGIKLVDPAGGAQGEIKVANTKINEWEELSFDFSDRIGNGQAGSTNIDQIVVFPDFDAARGQDNVVYFDNITFSADDGSGSGGGGTIAVPTTAAPTPTEDAANVISVYSDAYTDVAGTDFNPNWGQTTVYSEEAIEGNNTILYAGLNYQGIGLGSNQDVSSMDYLHIDFWTDNSTALNAFLISPGPVEISKALTVPTGGGWTSIDIPLGDFSPVDLADLIQFKFDGNGDIYLDNIYFYKGSTGGGGSATAPTTAAPIPTQDAANVISVYSDAYTDVSGTDYNPGWGQTTVYSEAVIAGDNTMLYTGLNYQGIVLGSSQNVSEMEFLHIDVWTANSTALNAFIISPGPVETGKALTVPTGGNWTSVDIPLTDFSPVDLADVFQMKFDGNGDVYLDNIYFYKSGSTGGGGSTGDYNLTLPIDFESDGFGANWTWNVFENDSDPALEFVANPDASGANTSSTVAKITALQAGAEWVGTETAHGEMGITWDLSASNSIIKIMVYKTEISDVGIKLATPAGGAQVEIKVANTKINEWEELTFDFSSRIGNGLDGSTNIDQIVVFPDFTARTQDNVVYFDNITFQ